MLKIILLPIILGYAFAATTPEMIQGAGYPVESHEVQTSDGYILTMHRIPSNGPAVFVMHGILSSSADFVVTGPNQALAYILSEAGYDVWLGNARGNKYSRQHVSLNPDVGSAFWNFGWHEIGILDLPAMIDYILTTTSKEKLYYIGHSQGTTTYFVMTSMLPEYNEKIYLMSAFAPVAFLGNMFSPGLRFLALGDNFNIYNIYKNLEFGSTNPILTSMEQSLCGSDLGALLICEVPIFNIVGFDPSSINLSQIPAILDNFPAGGSTNELIHYIQLIRTVSIFSSNSHGQFQQYDYGGFLGWNNVKMYGTATPPSYDLSQITAPMYLYYGENDWLVSESDVTYLKGVLSNNVVKELISYKYFNHIDYLYAIEAPALLYNDVIKNMKKYTT